MGRAFAKHVACSRKCDDNEENCAYMNSSQSVPVCLFCMYTVSVPGYLPATTVVHEVRSMGSAFLSHDCMPSSSLGLLRLAAKDTVTELDSIS